jgi:peptidoglycan hydrolase CwlO-like protein
MYQLTLPIVAILTSFITPTAIVGAAAFYLDNTFLTIQEYKLAGAENNVRILQEQIDSLQWDVDHDQATEKDKWLLEQKKQQLLEWQSKVQKIKNGRLT